MKKQKTKILYKSGLLSIKDMIIARDMPHKTRNEIINNIESSDIKTNYNVNLLATKLHPKYQEVYISEIINEDKNNNTKTLILRPQKSDQKLAFFRAGQYLSLVFDMNGNKISRPYSIASSPFDALNKNFYAITIKRKNNGFISNYILDKLKVNDKLVVSGPEGDFYYEELRDKKHILAIAGGSGITPFLSMAKAIVEENEDFYLTILFGNRRKENIIFYNQLLDFEKKSNKKIKVVHILSEEKRSDFHHGYINLNIIKKYWTKETSIYICGPKPMYDFILSEIRPLNLERKLIRLEASNEIGCPKNYHNYKNFGNKKIYKIKVVHFNEIYYINANANETILIALQKANIPTQSKCLSGKCSWCRIKVKKGHVFSPKDFASPRAADMPNNVYYSCSTFPVTDLEIESY